MIVNNAGKEEKILSQIKQWLILSNAINYIQYDKHPKNVHSLSISTVNEEKKRRERRYVKMGFWRDTRQIKGRIFICV